jgi:hypothetical protein
MKTIPGSSRLCLAVVLASACSSTGTNHVSSAPRRVYVNEVLITQQMIKSSAALTAWDVIEIRAPQLLASARNYHSMASGFGVAGPPLLVVDGSRTRDLTQLSQIPAEWVVAVHILNDTDGAMYYGTPGSYGVIVVETRQ